MTTTIERLSYLERELAVWKGRQERALSTGCKELISFYTDPDLNTEMGRMIGEIKRLKTELGMGHTELRRAGTRRVNPNKEAN